MIPGDIVLLEISEFAIARIPYPNEHDKLEQ